ncbi:alpha-amylase family glycosyl hydrolase [Streptomyces sp. NPDC003753]
MTIILALLIFAMLAVTYSFSAAHHTENLAASIIGVLGALALTFLALASPGALEELSFGPFKARWQIAELESRVQSLQLAVLTLLTCYERSHLRKLAGKQDDWVRNIYAMREELKRLQYLGYVKAATRSSGLQSIQEDVEEGKGFKLRDYLAITKMGEKYLELFEEWAPRIEVDGAGNVKIGGEQRGKAKNWDDIVKYAAKAGWLSEPDEEDVDWAPDAPAGLKKLLDTPRVGEPSGMGAIPLPHGTAFRVWAPHAEGVDVVGSFDGWAVCHPMTAESGGCWSTRLTTARPDDEYKYRVTPAQGGALWKIDPYARRLTSSVGNAVIDAADFDWGEQRWRCPSWDELVIYELHVGTFDRRAPDSGPGRFSGVINRLGALAELGVTAIELMPVTEYPGEASWGYEPVTAFAVANDYGSPSDLKALIKAAHEHGLAVLCDVVYNHFGPDDLDEGLRRFDGWYENDGDGIYFYNDGRRESGWGPRPDYGRPEVRQYLHDSALAWLQEYRMDGLRWDATASIRSTSTGAELPDGWALMRWVNDEIKARQPWKISIAEDLKGDPVITAGTPHGAGFDSQWDGGFVHVLRAALTAKDDGQRDMAQVCRAIEHRVGDRALARVIYTESHDTAAHNARLPEAICPGNAGSWDAKKRSTLGAAVMMTSPGIPMLFQGQEFLEEGTFDDRTPLCWSRRQHWGGIVQLYQDLIALRRNRYRTTAGLRGEHVAVYHCDDAHKVVAFHRYAWGGPRDSTVVVANFGNHGYNDYRIGLPRAGVWRVRFNSDWADYDPEFHDSPSLDVHADSAAQDGLPSAGTVGIGPYSAVILSQDE